MEFHAENALRPDLVLLPLDDEFVAFSETSQTVIGLNTMAAEIVTALKAGKPAAAIVGDLISRGAAGEEQAQEWLDSVREVLRNAGFVANGPLPPRAQGDLPADEIPPGMPPYQPFQSEAEHRYRLLDSCALIRFRNKAQARMVNTVIGHLATDNETEPTLVMDVDAKWESAHQIQSFVYRDGKIEGFARRLSFLGPMVKGMLWRWAINAHPFLFYIHAGVVAGPGGCVILPAAPGSGKSSLTAALTCNGFRYLSDEVALIETPEFDLQPMPLSFCAKSTGWDVMARYFPQILKATTHRRPDGKIVRYVAPPPECLQRTPGRVSQIIFPKYRADAQTRLTAMPRAEALRRVMEECLALRTRLTVEHVQRLIDTMSRIDCYALTFSSLDEAVALVSDAVGVRHPIAVNQR